MSKRTYRAKRIKEFDAESLRGAVEGQRVSFGIDIAKEVCFGRLVRSDFSVLGTVKWNQLTETRVLIDCLKQLQTLGAVLEVAMEPSGSYGDALKYQLRSVEIPVFRVGSKRTHDAQEVFDGVPSTHDPKAADIIARLHLHGLSSLWAVDDSEGLELAAEAELMKLHDDVHYQLLNRIEAVLGRHWPELTSVLELTRASLLALLEAFGDPQWVHREQRKAREVMQKAGGHMLSSTKIDRVLASAATTIGVPMLAAEAQMLRELASEARRHHSLALKARKRVRQLGRKHEAVERMSHVVGITTAAVLFVKMKDPRQYPAAAAYVKGAGLNLKVRSSGKHSGQLKITKRGPADARRYLFLAALRLVKHGHQGDPVVRAWYLRKVRRDGGVKLKAIIAVMRKLLSALWHVARGARFDASLLFDTRRLGLAPGAK